MTEGCTDLELVQRAVAGDRDSISALAGAVQDRVYPYINRVLLDEDRARDLTQETLLAVLNALGSLRQPDRFWPWAFRIATNQIRLHFRTRRGQKTVSMSAVEGTGAEPACHRPEEGVAGLARRELAELTRSAMADLGERQRMVLALRFYEDMPYAEVARVLGCTELVARMTLFRAKSALLRQLRRRGVRDASVLSALVAFGQLTAPSGASGATVAVSSAAVTETALGILLSAKGKMVGAACVAALLLFGGLFSFNETAGKAALTPPGVRNIHFTEQSLIADSTDIEFGVRSKGAYEQWYHFPRPGGEAFLFRMQRWNPEQTQKLCWWVQNEDANYYVHAGDGTVQVQNARLYHSDLRVKRLPTDPEHMWTFLHGMEAPVEPDQPDALVYERDPESGHLRSRLDDRFPQLGSFRTDYVYSHADPEPGLFDVPAGAKVVDERDEMHRRGWTYFRIAGEVGGRRASGQGRLPFTYLASLEQPAWMRLEVDGGPIARDSDQGASIVERPPLHQKRTAARGAPVRAFFAQHALLAGFPRPWTGFHTVDVIRRDAAQRGIWFSTELIEPDKLVEIVLLDSSDSGYRMARYLVDLPNDLLKEVRFWSSPDGVFGEPSVALDFEYLEEVAGLDHEFIERAPAGPAHGGTASPGPFWPLLLHTEVRALQAAGA